MIVVNSSTRQFNIPGADLVFGVESDSGSERKNFQCPRYVGNNLDIAGSFVRMNYRNANGEIDEYLVEDVAVEGDNVTFSWELKPKVTMYKGNISFVMCVVGPDTKVKWHTTLGRGQVLEGLEPDNAIVEEGTADVVAQLIAMVEAQTAAVEAEGEKQIKAVQTAAKNAESDAVAEIEAKGVNTRNSIPADYTALSEAVDALTRGRAGAIVCEAEGSAVVVSDASDLPIQGLRIFGRSTQDGTPTPDAPVEIKSVVEPVVTVAGKNRCSSQNYGVVFPCRLEANVTYTVSVDNTVSDAMCLLIYNENQERFQSVKCTSDNGERRYANLTPTQDVYYAMWAWANATSVRNGQVEIGANATTYETYVGQTVELTHTISGIPVTSGGNYTDSDGQQWICDEVDLERGVYVQRTATVVVNGSNNPSTFATGNKGGSVFAYSYDDLKMNILRNRGHKLCDRLQRPTNNNPTSFKDCEIGCWGYNTVGSNDMFIVMNVGKFNSADDVKSWLSENPVTFVYVLATPIEKPLSETEIAAYRALHSNYPNTTVLNDAGAHMVVKYAADTKLYIDNKITALIGG